ncbi:hypothetical protein ACFYUK_14800 [Nonomuraea wenchangensis]
MANLRYSAFISRSLKLWPTPAGQRWSRALDQMAEARPMTRPAVDLRFEPLAAEVRVLLERYGYRLPSGDHVRDLVLARVEAALKNLVEIYEGRTW